MRVGLDARHAGRGLGIANFVQSLAQELVGFPDLELVWLGEPALAPPGTASTIGLTGLPYPLLDGPLGRARIARAQIDVMHFTGNTGWGRRGPVASVLTLQDLIFLRTAVGRPRSARQVFGHAYERRLIGRAVAAADVLAVSSQAVATETVERFGAAILPEVVPYGVGRPPPFAKAPGRPYLLGFAGRDPRKRTADLVAAWRALSSGDDAPALELDLHLLASAGLAPELRATLAPDVARGRVRLLDHVRREQVWLELGGALALAYPSTAEGFGLPVLEGLAAGTPVLSGLAPATREVGGDAIVQLDPGDIAGSIAAAIRRLVTDPEHRRAVSDRGRARATGFTWRATATGYRRLYELALERRR